VATPRFAIASHERLVICVEIQQFERYAARIEGRERRERLAERPVYAHVERQRDARDGGALG